MPDQETAPAPAVTQHNAAPTASPEGLRDLRTSKKESKRETPYTPVEAVRAAGNEEELDGEERISATDWFLSEDPIDDTLTLEVNVGTSRSRKVISWTIKPIDSDVLRRIQKLDSRNTRRGRESDLNDEIKQNCRVIVAGTVEPDLIEMATAMDLTTPESALMTKFNKKTGILAQIAGEIMGISGFDNEDVREAAAAS